MTDRLDDLIAAVRDGSDDSAYDELSQLIATDPAARRRYLLHVAVWSELSAGLIAPAASTLIKPNLPTLSHVEGSEAKVRIPESRFRRITPLALAAALLIAAAALAIYLLAGASDDVQPSPAPVATIIEATGTMMIDGDIGHEGGEYASGAYALDRGSAQLVLANRVAVDLTGETELDVHGRMSASLRRGSARFRCPVEAVGYTVHLPGGSRIVDLGTAFSIDVRESKIVVRVTEGSVRFEPAASSTMSERVLRVGQVIHLDRAADTAIVESVDPVWPDSGYATRMLGMKPVMYLPMDESDGRVVHDVTRRGHAGYELRGDATFAAGASGRSILLGGPAAPGYVITNDWSAPSGDRYTVSAWVWADSRPDHASIVKNWGSFRGGRFHLDIWRDGAHDLAAAVRTTDDSDLILREQVEFPLKQWQHVVLVVDGDRIALYRNGNPVAHATNDRGLISEPIESLGIGAKPDHADGSVTNGFWHGRLDEIALFDRALTDDEVLDLFKMIAPGRQSPAPTITHPTNP